MKKLLFLLLLTTPLIVSTQNWMPVNPDYQYTYDYINGTGNLRTIKVDSLKQEGDSLFLNRIIAPQYGDASYNQPQFLGRLAVVEENGDSWAFLDTIFQVIRPNSQFGETWIFDSAQNIEAEVLSIYEQELFGQVDSVKLIYLSTGDSILLTKNFGFLRYPELPSNDRYYELTGVKRTDDYVGLINPTFKEIFDFEIGDQFEYRMGTWFGPGGENFIKRRFEIIGKIENPTSYVYQIKGVELDIFIWDPTYIVDTTWFEESLIYDQADYGGLNLASYEPLFSETQFYEQVQMVAYSYDNITEFCGYSLYTKELPYHGIVYQVAPTPDDPYYLMCLDCYEQPFFDNIHAQFKAGLGKVYNFAGNAYPNYELLAFRKGDFQCNEFSIPDALLLTETEEEIAQHSELVIFPNPVKDKLNINTNGSIADLIIRDALGRVIFDQKELSANRQTIDFSFLQSGIYFIQFRNREQKVIQVEKILKQ